ncbi:helix-turn-helix domain-containing protein [Burkholderia metallica]|uniref:helix-turn-helix domain-containing protein n=1 Tax=Burkholderia metallica TaxID=488729 RepID=UPI001CF24CC6|nr:helix-turn-helix domain-containing protein [Burkholderia metallica]MCA8023661.1 helix-turn-helix domain-containing protein [Burkholderia metallica]
MAGLICVNSNADGEKMERSRVYISLDHIPENERVDYWRTLCEPLYSISAVEGCAHPPSGSLIIQCTGNLHVVHTSFSDQIGLRDRGVISRSADPNYAIVLTLSGHTFWETNGVLMETDPGDITICDLNVPVRWKGYGENLSVTVERKFIETITNRKKLHGRLLKSDLPISKLLRSYILGVHAIMDELPEDSSEAVQDSLVSLVMSINGGVGSELLDSRWGPSAVLKNRVLDFIDQNLFDRELSPDMLMHRFRVSRAHLYRAFDDVGGITTIIKEKRLVYAYRELASSKAGRGRIRDISEMLGFSSPEQFSKAFRSYFGCVPGDVRSGQNVPDRSVEGVRFYFDHMASFFGTKK